MTIVAVGNQSASAKIVEGGGELLGIYVASSSSLTLKVWDGVTAAGPVIVNTTAAITAPGFHPMPATFVNGIYVTIGGTGNYSVHYER